MNIKPNADRKSRAKRENEEKQHHTYYIWIPSCTRLFMHYIPIHCIVYTDTDYHSRCHITHSAPIRISYQINPFIFVFKKGKKIISHKESLAHWCVALEMCMGRFIWIFMDFYWRQRDDDDKECRMSGEQSWMRLNCGWTLSHCNERTIQKMHWQQNEEINSEKMLIYVTETEYSHCCWSYYDAFFVSLYPNRLMTSKMHFNISTIFVPAVQVVNFNRQILLFCTIVSINLCRNMNKKWQNRIG